MGLKGIYTEVISPIFKLLRGKCPHRCIHQNMYILRGIHVVLMCILTMVAFPWTMLPGPFFTPSNFDHYFILFGTWLFDILRVTQLNEELLEDRELERQATNLDFTSLANATCSNQRDEARIRADIAGFESEVEIAILILMKAGAYDDSPLVFAEDFVNLFAFRGSRVVLDRQRTHRRNCVHMLLLVV